MRFILPCQEVITSLDQFDEEKRREEGYGGSAEFGYISGGLWVVDAWDFTHRMMVHEIPDQIEIGMEELIGGVIFLRDIGYVVSAASASTTSDYDIICRSSSMKRALSNHDAWYVPIYCPLDEEDGFERIEWKQPNEKVELE